jgi:serine/threonine protein kinase/tetratricopeptide (TPR) repeat protein
MQEQSIFIEALEKEDPAAQAAFLDQACAGDAALRQRMARLLERHRQDSFLESPAAAFPSPLAGEGMGVRGTTINDPITERPGTVIGPYKLLEQIGEGGFGVVFMAEQQQPIRRKVALKVLKPGMDTRQVVARFEAERQALALMDHPNIAHVHDGGETASRRPYFVMELVRGVPISDFCDQNQLPIRERLELFVSVCQAVQHAHQKGVIHRDLKPSNVMVTLHDDKAVVKVIDFGIAKATGQQLTEKTLFTNFAQMIGTPLYMSPEQAQMSGLDVDTRSDIYSLGVLLYELLTGTTPFDKERFKEVGYDEMRRIIREEEPPKPSTRVSTLGQAATTVSINRKSDPKRLSQLCRGELDWIVMKALEKDRNRRYGTASALAADVQHCLNDEPVTACPPSIAYRFGKFARRNKVALAMACVVTTAVLLVVATLAGSIGWVVGDRARRREEAVRGVERALEDAQRLQKQGKWGEARAALRGSESLLATAGNPEELAQRCRQVEADLTMLSKLELARLERTSERADHFDNQAADQAYRAAFAEYGLPVLDLDPAVAAERVVASAIAQELVAALDDWAGFVSRSHDLDLAPDESAPPTLNPADRAKLLALAQVTDPDPWRQQVRDAISRGNQTRLLELSRQVQVLEQPPATLVLLAQSSATTDLPGATALLRRMQRQHPDDFWINHELGKCLSALKPPQVEEAIGYFRTAVALRPQSPGVYVNLGVALAKKGEIEEALAAFQHAVRLKPDYAQAHCNIGYCFTWLGQPDQAITECHEALRLKPDFPCALVTLADALFNKGRPADAIAALDQALRLDPEFAAAESNLAFVLATSPDPKFRDAKRAVKLAQQAVRRRPNANNWGILGTAQYRAGDWNAAIAALKKSMELHARVDEEECLVLAMAHWQLGKKVEARQWYDKGVAWMEKNNSKSEQTIRLRAEAEALLAMKENKK